MEGGTIILAPSGAAGVARRLARRFARWRTPAAERRLSGAPARLGPVRVLIERRRNGGSLSRSDVAALRAGARMLVVLGRGAENSVWLDEALRSFRALAPDAPIWTTPAGGAAPDVVSEMGATPAPSLDGDRAERAFAAAALSVDRRELDAAVDRRAGRRTTAGWLAAGGVAALCAWAFATTLL